MTTSKAAYYAASRKVLDAFDPLTETEALLVLGAALYYVSKRDERLIKSNAALIESMAMNAYRYGTRKKTVLEK